MKPHMDNVVSRFNLHVEPVDGFELRVRFDKEQYPDLRLDEPAPLGKDSAPNPSRVLAAAVAGCLSASLLFCLRKAGVRDASVSATVDVSLVRNEHKRLRIGKVAVALHPAGQLDAGALSRCITDFEDFCVVTQSVRAGLDVQVEVVPPSP